MRPEQPENPEEITGFSDDPGGGASPGPDTDGPADPAPDDVPEHATRAEAGDALLARVLALVRHLRAHCPWDARQTPRSLRPYLLEEAHETADAVLAGDDDELAGELGDLLLNVAFQVVLAEERGAFDAPEVVGRLEAKMRERHPHVYGDAEEAPDWEELKARERTAGDASPAGVPEELEPFSRSLRVQQRAAAVGFDWPDAGGALDKLVEEVEELRALAEARAADGASGGGREANRDESPAAAGTGGPPAPHPGGTVPDPEVEGEVGDLLFSAVNVARLSGVHPSAALARATRKFEVRFAELARRARERSVDLEEASLEEMETLWREVKAEES